MSPSVSSRDQSLQDLLVFHNVARALTSSLDLDSILHVIMKQMEQLFQPETWSLLVVDEKNNDLYFAVAGGRKTDKLRDVRVAMGEGIAGWVAEHGETLIVPHVGLDPRFSSSLNGSSQDSTLMPGRESAQSAICIPLRARSKTLGVLQLFDCRMDTLTDYMISFLHVLCDYAAIAIENAHAVERIHELTITDDCTMLFNVRFLYEKLEEEIERARRTKTPLSLIFIDLDHFKWINDQHGHLIGSRLLTDVGQKIKEEVRAIDMTFRYGGDEFIVLLPSTSKEQAIEIGRRLRDTLRSQFFTMGENLHLNVRASLGVATYPECGSTVHQIISKADEAMYRVKNNSRDDIAAAEDNAAFDCRIAG